MLPAWVFGPVDQIEPAMSRLGSSRSIGVMPHTQQIKRAGCLSVSCPPRGPDTSDRHAENQRPDDQQHTKTPGDKPDFVPLNDLETSRRRIFSVPNHVEKR